MTRTGLSPAKQALLAQRLKAGKAARVTVPPRPAGTHPPLSHAQERLWFLEQYAPGTTAYTVAFAVRLEGGEIDEAALERALAEVARRHESLRTRFVTTDDGTPEIVLDDDPRVGFRVSGDAAAAHEIVQEELDRPFDLANGPLMRVLLVRLAAREHVLLLTMHHAVTDGWSCDIVMEELLALHEAYRTGTEADLAAPPVQYGDYAVWERGRTHDDDIRYWRERLAGLPPLELPTDLPRPPEQGAAGAAHRFVLDRALADALTELGRANGATLYMTLLAAFEVLLARYSGQDDFAVGSPVSGRELPELERVVGLFINSLPMRADLSGDPAFTELLGRVRETALDAYAHQELPFDRLVGELGVERDVSRSPVFQVMFALQNYRSAPLRGQGLTLSAYPFEVTASRFDLGLYLMDLGDGLHGNLTYRTELFRPATVARLAECFENLLRSIVAAPGTRVSDLELLPEAERRRVLGFAGAPADLPAAGVSGVPPASPEPAHLPEPIAARPHEWNSVRLHEVIAAQAARTPSATAVVCGGDALTYAELDAAADRLAGRLRALGARRDDRVAICLEQSTGLAVAVLGVLKSGAAYLPLDPEHPASRLGYVLADAGARLVVTSADLLDRLPDDVTPVYLDEDHAPEAPAADEETGTPGDLAYVIYTSGTTGRPKGVAVQHHEVLVYLAGVRERLGVEPASSFALLQSLAFDFGVTVFYLCLMTGGTLHLVPSRTAGPELAEIFRRTGIDYLKITPSHLATLLASVNEATLLAAASDATEPVSGRLADGGSADLLPRKLLLLGGEAAPRGWAAELEATGRCRVVNHYGPTEATVGVTTYDVARLPAPDGPAEASVSLPIGSPLPGARAYVLDERLRPVPAGVPGEVYLGGDRLARGYLNRPGLTADRFVPDPYGPPGARMYRTGDLGRWTDSGDLEFLGRRDLQVKIRGYRVELGEIESVLTDHPDVAQAVVEPRGEQLVAYLVPAAGSTTGPDAGSTPDGPAERPGAAAVRAWLADRLPAYMIPSRYAWLDELPLKSHGKVDRSRLPEPEADVPAAEYVAPEPGPEEDVAGVWAEVLEVERVGAHDDFFALGGHSLLAMRVIARLRRAYPDRPVTVLDVFKHRTVRELARLLTAEGDVPRSLLHRLTPARTATTTLVCVPYGGGSAVVYQPLADALPADWALYSVAVPGHELGEEPRPFEEVVLGCVAEIAEIMDRNGGSLVLYGHCGLGVMLSAEITRKLEAEGHAVDALYLGGVFPFARPGRGLNWLGTFFDRLTSDQQRVNALTAAGLDVEDLGREQVKLIVRNRREGTRAAERYFTRIFEEGGSPALRAPVIAVVGERDPAAEFYQERYKEWHCLSDETACVVLDEAGHFFLRYRNTELADIVTGTHPALASGRTEGMARDESRTWWLQGVSRQPAGLAAGAGSNGADAVLQDGPADTMRNGAEGVGHDGLTVATRNGAEGPGHDGPEAAGQDGFASTTRNGQAGQKGREAPVGSAEAPPRVGPPPSMRRFLVVAAGQLVSITGSALTEFAIPLWIYLTTGSLARFALFSVLGLLPGMLVAPLAGTIVDRFDRRRVMLAGDVAAGGTQLALGVLLWTGNLQVWHIYPLLVCLSVALTFQRLAYGSAIPQLVPKRFLGHANGVVQMAAGTAQLIVPLIAVGLMAAIGLEGILVIDVASYVVATVTLLLVRFPATMAWKRRESVLAEMMGGIRHSWGNRGFRAMLFYFAVLNVFLSPLFLMISPLVLSFASLAEVGRVSFAGGLGAFLGGLAMAAWGGPRRRRLHGVLVSTLALSVFCLLTGLRPDLFPIAAGAFGMSLCLTLLNGVYATIIQVKVPQRFHGRVIALNTLVAWSTLPIGFGLVAPYGAQVFEPLLAPGGPLAGTVGAVLGTGPGRGIGFMYACFALAIAAVALVGMRIGVLRRFDDEVPDALPDDVVGYQALTQRIASVRAADGTDGAGDGPPAPGRVLDAVAPVGPAPEPAREPASVPAATSGRAPEKEQV
ncbi:amino acid adenylation domain-containing protein [Microbispora cellulosiformans]|uniref:Amino acid adenylation domain-containing protein n=1 Tax=Microbispora cellulosiformans TaxID=2614688 RepID=A0A5J5K0S8_9ACTN|nr:non-ribosomal peptide synthetase/MFS transporter [Microbispora cellulosiformans]KAA9377702.1 amino acid adenylation domain-containing protein [Microbispora cellulosiformans]